MQLVVDTNVVVSGLLKGTSVPAEVLGGIASRKWTPVVCEAAVAEYRAVLPRPHLRLNQRDVGEFLALIEQLADWVEVPAYTGSPALPDAGDWPFIACALAADCPVVTGNLKHFPSGLGVRAMTAREWVQQFGGAWPA